MDGLVQASAFGTSLVAVLYYLNQAAKRNGYVAPKWVLALTLGESFLLVGLYFFAPRAFTVVLAALGLAAAVTMFHGAIKDKAGGQ